MTHGAVAERVLAEVRERTDATLRGFLADRRGEMAELDAEAAVLVDELLRLVDAGGKRLRPAFCVLGFRAAGGATTDPAIWPAAAALELFHTFALIHDDVIDGATTRRGAPTTVAAFGGGDRGLAAAILVGDLGAELAGALLRSAPAPADRLERAFARWDAMVMALAAGQFLDAAGPPAADLAASLRVARLKSAAYTVEAPLAIGVTLAGDEGPIGTTLATYGRNLGEAFQLRDDLLDGDAAPGIVAGDVDARIAAACAALDGAEAIEPSAAEDLRALARSLAMGEAVA
jgi:geranylgeranyl diphosphate synthase type I